VWTCVWWMSVFVALCFSAFVCSLVKIFRSSMPCTVMCVFGGMEGCTGMASGASPCDAQVRSWSFVPPRMNALDRRQCLPYTGEEGRRWMFLSVRMRP